MRTLVRLYIGITLFLIAIGTLLVFSASGYFAAKHSSTFYFFNLHVIKAAIGIMAGIVVATVNYKVYEEYSKEILIVTILMLVAVLLFAPKVNGAARWINLGIVHFQPSELVRLVLILHLSKLIIVKKEKIKDFRHGLFYLLVWVFGVAGLVFLQPNVSLSIIIVLSSFVLLYVGGARVKQLLISFFTVAIFGGPLALLLKHSRTRILQYFHSLTTGDILNPQVLQAQIALGSGGFAGVGLGQSHQSNGFIPEAYGDFIYSILGEELGFLGAVLILTAYLALFFIGILIAKRVADKFAQLVVFGISFGIFLSAFINVAVTTGLFPTTGITLPFVSYGGTSLIVGCISVGIVINIALKNKQQNVGVVEI
jgi:cell division protein FtsW